MAYVGVVVHLLRYRNGKPQILFLYRAGGQSANQWWPIAGKIKEGESTPSAAFREIKEETGLVPQQLYDTEMSVPHLGPDAAPEKRICIYVGFVSPDDNIRLNYEHSDFKWLDLDEAKNIVIPRAANATEYVLNRIRKEFLENEPIISRRIFP